MKRLVFSRGKNSRYYSLDLGEERTNGWHK